MAYATIDDLRGAEGYLEQFEGDGTLDTTHDSVLLAILERAEAFVNSYIGTPTSLSPAAAATTIVYGNGLQTLMLPPIVPGSVTLVTAPSGYTIPDYIEQDGALVLTDSAGIVVQPYRSSLAFTTGSPLRWTYGVPYTVSATFGWSAGDLAILAEATLQTAVQLWRFRDTGGSDVSGTEGAVVVVKAGWTPLVKSGLDDIARRVRGFNVGVW